ncbi:hypothetical protein [Streptomyces resistomycificus]|uniref:Secreted protein n=1 Tax=Streptomyces resistomycificus TaxID=67356 RepID=A0A0L8L009_9ACTN|nr:hypothetical protein [Streptomyces resistomycificus]KOG31374.1 hypothetical protein ADK37_30885 [Streptomyces resistomycificus]KUN94273.1 hypothetical protein AQJ84_26635 [Streptomyces resistomycificus]
MNLVRDHHKNRTRSAAAAAVTLLAAAALGTAGAGAADAGTAAPQTQLIASSVLGSDYKVTLTALRSTEDQFAASVRLQVYTQTGGAWKESDRVTVGDVEGWFWYPVTGSGAVCEFSTASTEPAPLTVSLKITPSIGCSQPAHYVVKEGRVFAG